MGKFSFNIEWLRWCAEQNITENLSWCHMTYGHQEEHMKYESGTGSKQITKSYHGNWKCHKPTIKIQQFHTSEDEQPTSSQADYHIKKGKSCAFWNQHMAWGDQVWTGRKVNVILYLIPLEI